MFYSQSREDKIIHQKIDHRYIFTVADRYYTGKIEYILSIRIPYRFLGIRFYHLRQISYYYPQRIETAETAVSKLKMIAERMRMEKVKARNKKKAIFNIK